MTAPVLASDFAFDLDGFAFGCGTNIEVSDLDLGNADTRAQDLSSPTLDARRFGRDLKTPATWSFVLTIKEWDQAAALAILEDLQGAWDAAEARATPGAVSTLRYRLGSRVRVVHGRPRGFTPVVTNLVFGRIRVVADFALADTLHYDDEVKSSEPMALAASTVEGFTTPWVMPLSPVSAASPVTTEITVGGRRPTWALAEFTGTLVGAYMTVDGWTVTVNDAIPGGLSVTVDPRPWAQVATRDDGLLVTGLGRTRLAAMRLTPGSHNVEFGAAMSGAGNGARLLWRDAYKAL